jgi:hypothetical protein
MFLGALGIVEIFFPAYNHSITELHNVIDALGRAAWDASLDQVFQPATIAFHSFQGMIHMKLKIPTGKEVLTPLGPNMLP